MYIYIYIYIYKITNTPHQDTEELLALYAVEATFAVVYLCLLFSTSLNFQHLFDSLKIFLSSRIKKEP